MAFKLVSFCFKRTYLIEIYTAFPTRYRLYLYCCILYYTAAFLSKYDVLDLVNYYNMVRIIEALPLQKVDQCRCNYFKKNSTSLLSCIRDLDTVLTKRIEFSERKTNILSKEETILSYP